MDTWSSPVDSQEGCVTMTTNLERDHHRPLRDHPVMDRLDTILRDLPEDRQAAFMDMLQKDETSHAEEE
jgi:hypothetical protein